MTAAPLGNDNRANNVWLRAKNAYDHYLTYLDSKADKYSLSFVDLIYVKNFKGGSSVISEPINGFAEKIKKYEGEIRELQSLLGSQNSLGGLDESDFIKIKPKIVAFSSMATIENTRIKGFGPSFSSALLHFYFPNIVPILDRRALNGAGISGLDVNNQGQVTNMMDKYPELINYFRKRMKGNIKIELRDIDQELFRIPLGHEFGRKKVKSSSEGDFAA